MPSRCHCEATPGASRAATAAKYAFAVSATTFFFAGGRAAGLAAGAGGGGGGGGAAALAASAAVLAVTFFGLAAGFAERAGLAAFAAGDLAALAARVPDDFAARASALG